MLGAWGPWIAAALGGLAAVLVAWLGGARFGRAKEQKRRMAARVKALAAAREFAEKRIQEDAERQAEHDRAVDEIKRHEQAEIDKAPSQEHADSMLAEGGKWRDE